MIGMAEKVQNDTVKHKLKCYKDRHTVRTDSERQVLLEEILTK